MKSKREETSTVRQEQVVCRHTVRISSRLGPLAAICVAVSAINYTNYFLLLGRGRDGNVLVHADDT